MSNELKRIVKNFRKKVNVPTESYNDARYKAHRQAFVVAGAIQADLLNDLRSAVDDAITNGMSLDDFVQEFEQIAKRNNWKHSKTPYSRAKFIYQTNLVQAANAAKVEAMYTEEAVENQPFLWYRHGPSKVPRIEHLAWDNIVLPKSSAWWLTHMPQSNWGCTCYVIPVTEKDIKARGLKITDIADIKYQNQGVDDNFATPPVLSSGVDIDTIKSFRTESNRELVNDLEQANEENKKQKLADTENILSIMTASKASQEVKQTEIPENKKQEKNIISRLLNKLKNLLNLA